MPRIPDATALGARPTPSALQPIVRQGGAESARAKQQLGGTLVGIGDDMYRRQAEAEAAEGRNALNQFEAGLHDPTTGLRSKRGKDSFDLTEKVPAQFDEYASKVAGGMQNKRAREAFTEMAAARREQIGRMVGDYVGREREGYEAGQYKAGIESSINRVSLTPTALKGELDFQSITTTARLRRQGASDEEISGAVFGIESDTHSAVMDRYLSQDRLGQASAHFRDYSERLTPKARAHYQNALDVQGKRQQAELRVALADQVDDAVAAYSTLGTFDKPPTRAQFAAAYPEDGAERYAKFEKYQQLGANIARVSALPPQDLGVLLEKERPAATEGFKDAAERYGLLQRAIAQSLKHREDDPAGYVLMHSDRAKSAYTAMAQAMNGGDASAQIDAYARTARAEQERLGMKPQIIPRAYADSVVQEISTAKNPAEAIAGLSQSWGRHWPDLYGAIAKDLPPAAAVIGSGVTGMPAQILAEISTMKEGELKAGLPQGAASDVSKSLSDEFEAFGQTLAEQGGGSQTFNTFYGEAEKLALYYVRSGTKPAEAARRAAAQVINDRYEFRDTYRVPQGVDADAVTASARSLVAGYQPRLAAADNGGYPAVDGLVERGNINLFDRPAVRNADGSTSSIRSISANVNGVEVLMPTVSEDGRIMSDAEAIAQYRSTGRHLGKLRDVASADRYAEALHRQQASLAAGLPALLVPEKAGVPDEARASAWAAQIRASGFWVTSPDESGLTLFVTAADGNRPVLAADGKPVSLSWQVLMEAPGQAVDPYNFDPASPSFRGSLTP